MQRGQETEQKLEYTFQNLRCFRLAGRLVNIQLRALDFQCDRVLNKDAQTDTNLGMFTSRQLSTLAAALLPCGLFAQTETVLPATPVRSIASSRINLEALPRTLPETEHIVFSHCNVQSKVLAMTFDDGPHIEFTPKLLDLLKERGIKATFFLVGKNAQAYPQIVKRIVDEGHEVANHSWSHSAFNKMGEAGVTAELQKTQDAIVKACGVAPIIYRPPYGAITLSQKKWIHEKFGMPTILWEVDPLDWKAPRSSEKVYNEILKQTYSGSIILAHDIHGTTVEAMPSTLDALKAQGFQFVTVTQLINLEVLIKAFVGPPSPDQMPPKALPVTE